MKDHITLSFVITLFCPHWVPSRAGSLLVWQKRLFKLTYESRMHHSSLQRSRFICYYKRKQHNITSGSILEVPVTQNDFSFIYSFVSFSCFKPTSWLVLYYLRSRSTALTYEDYVYSEKLSPRYSSFPLFLSLCTKGLRANLRSINFTFVICAISE